MAGRRRQLGNGYHDELDGRHRPDRHDPGRLFQRFRCGRHRNARCEPHRRNVDVQQRGQFLYSLWQQHPDAAGRVFAGREYPGWFVEPQRQPHHQRPRNPGEQPVRRRHECGGYAGDFQQYERRRLHPFPEWQRHAVALGDEHLWRSHREWRRLAGFRHRRLALLHRGGREHRE